MDRGGGDDDDNNDDAVVNNFMYESTLQLRKSMYDDLLSHYTYYRERERERATVRTLIISSQ